jgi:hypothetical protein
MSRAAPKIKPRADPAKSYQSSQRSRKKVKLRAGDYCPPPEHLSQSRHTILCRLAALSSRAPEKTGSVATG